MIKFELNPQITYTNLSLVLQKSQGEQLNIYSITELSSGNMNKVGKRKWLNSGLRIVLSRRHEQKSDVVLLECYI